MSTKRIVHFTEKKMWNGLIKMIEFEDCEILMAKVYKEHLQKVRDHLEQ